MAAIPVEGQVGLGIDLVDIARMKRILQRTPSFAQKVFSDAERAYCDARANPESHYATRFAAKEAVVKALGTGFSRGITVRDIEVVRSAKGAPRAVLHGRALEVAREQGVVSLPLSLSFTHSEAVACAMAITSSSVSAMEKRQDPMKQLAQQFKAVRALLDELDVPASGNASAAESKPAAESGPAVGSESAVGSGLAPTNVPDAADAGFADAPVAMGKEHA
jgi:holo-[acyl-carrier protein] synthase